MSWIRTLRVASVMVTQSYVVTLTVVSALTVKWFLILADAGQRAGAGPTAALLSLWFGVAVATCIMWSAYVVYSIVTRFRLFKSEFEIQMDRVTGYLAVGVLCGLMASMTAGTFVHHDQLPVFIFTATILLFFLAFLIVQNLILSLLDLFVFQPCWAWFSQDFRRVENELFRSFVAVKNH